MNLNERLLFLVGNRYIDVVDTVFTKVRLITTKYLFC